MKLVIITTNAPPLVGGLERISHRIASNISGVDGDSWIVCRFTKRRRSLHGYFSEHEDAREFHWEGVPIRIVSPTGLRKLLMGSVFRLIWRKATFPIAKLIYEICMSRKLTAACRGADVLLYIGSGTEMLGFSALQAATKLKIPFVVEPAIHPGQWGDSWIDQKLYRSADKLLAHSNYEATLLRSIGIAKDKVTTIRHGFDFRFDGKAVQFRDEYRVTGPVILFLGRKTKSKGVLRLLRAFRECRSKFCDATLVIAGPCVGKEQIPRTEGVLDIDDLSESQKHNALAACDVLCVPSEGESFGMVYFEAWAYEKPVIALDLPALRETIGQCQGGILVSTSNEALVIAITRLLSDPSERLQMGRNGSSFARQYDWENAIKSYHAVFAPLVGKQ